MPLRRALFPFVFLFVTLAHAQLPVARENIFVFKNGTELAMPWAGGFNAANVSNTDVNGDGRQDLVFFDQQDIYRNGIFRCFLHDGTPGQLKFRSDPGLSYFFPPLSFWAVLRDYDGDGRPDIFTSTTGGIKVFRNITPPGGLPAFEVASALLHSEYYPHTPTKPSNLYAGTSGPAGIADVDGDGDLDILTFTPLGIYLELHRNLSRELYGHSDSLIFQRDDECWGDLAESTCAVDFEVCSSKRSAPLKVQHAGACIACLDNDGDNDIDLIMGDVSCDFVFYVDNGGTQAVADFNDTTRLYPNFPQKNDGTTAIKMNFYPCAYPVDADNDGKTDLIAMPNVVAGENVSSVWLYRNVSAGKAADFRLHQKDFLQDQMIDVGQNSYPVLMDTDADGKKELVIGTRGMYLNGKFSSRLTLYRNVGTQSVPVFSFVTSDFAGVSSYSLNSVIPAPGDIDGDGDLDLCIGTSGGQIHWLENTAGAGKPFAAAPLKLSPFNIVTESAMAAPQVFDLDGDGKQDLLAGMKNGRVAWYRNIGTAGVPSFTLVTSNLGSIDVKGDPAYFGNDGFAVPYFFKEGSSRFALIGSVSGNMFLYKIGSHDAPFTLVTNGVNALMEGSHSAPWYEDIDGDGKRDLFVGNATGGLSYFSSSSPFVGVNELHVAQEKLACYPNPTSSDVFLKTRGEFVTVTITDVTGRILYRQKQAAQSDARIDMSNFSRGVYFITAEILHQGVPSQSAVRIVRE